MKKLLIIALTAVFIISTGLVLTGLIDYTAAEDKVEDAIKLALPDAAQEPAKTPDSPAEKVLYGEGISEYTDIPDEPLPLDDLPETVPLPSEAQLLADTDLEALKQVNGDVFGWIYIPNGDISHPLVKSYDNSEYLSHAWDGTKSRSGAIFLERKNNTDMSDFNTLIYGHNMKNNKFFAPLHSYKEQEHRDACPYVYIRLEGRLLQYEVFAAYKANVVSDTYRLYFPDDSVKDKALSHYLSESRWHSGVEVTNEDKILTLSTCTKAGDDDLRWVVQAVLVYEWEL